jgi:hypothetical protein
MPKGKQKSTMTPLPGRCLCNKNIGPPIPPEPDPPDRPSPLEANPFNVLDQSNSDDDHTKATSSNPSGSVLSLSNHDISSKLDALISMINTKNSNFEVMKMMLINSKHTHRLFLLLLLLLISIKFLRQLERNQW